MPHDGQGQLNTFLGNISTRVQGVCQLLVREGHEFDRDIAALEPASPELYAETLPCAKVQVIRNEG
jgi:hypothetical protein